MEIRDPVHGFVELTEHEARIISHPAFQRLRRIRQLAMADLVYPGATHTRFSHSIGVLHVADALARGAGLDQDRVRYVRLAALLHDIGHGPFSHVSEYVLASRNPRAAEESSVEEVHEAIGVQIIRTVLLAQKVINESECQEITSVLSGRPRPDGTASRSAAQQRTVERDIVSGPLDADKLDYLLRDNYHCGVKYGVYDLDRIRGTVRKLADPDGVQSYLAVVEEDVSAVDQFIIAKHNMTTQVYRHKVRRITDAMLTRSVLLALEEGNQHLKGVYDLHLDEESYLQRYLQCDDEQLVRWVMGSRDGPAHELMRRLRERCLLKEVFREPLQKCRDESLREELLKRDQAGLGFRELERKLATACCVRQHHLVFVDVLRQRPPRRRAAEPMVDPQSIHVIGPGGERKAYDAVSQFFRHSELRGDDFVCVYMPVDETDTHAKRAAYARLREAIGSALGFGRS